MARRQNKIKTELQLHQHNNSTSHVIDGIYLFLSLSFRIVITAL